MAQNEVTSAEIAAVESIVVSHAKYVTEDLYAMFRDEASRPTFEMLRDVVYNYLSTYNGTFQFLIDMKVRYLMVGFLTMKQAAGVVNCYRAQINYEAKNAEKAAIVEKVTTGPVAVVDNKTVVTTSPIANGIYTVYNDTEGEHVTLRVTDHWIPEELAKGKQVAKYLSGSDNDNSYTGFATIIGSSFKVWSRFNGDSNIVNAMKALMSSTAEERGEYGYNYAKESGRCCKCGRTLTVPASINRGMGPECAKKG